MGVAGISSTSRTRFVYRAFVPVRVTRKNPARSSSISILFVLWVRAQSVFKISHLNRARKNPSPVFLLLVGRGTLKVAPPDRICSPEE